MAIKYKISTRDTNTNPYSMAIKKHTIKDIDLLLKNKEITPEFRQMLEQKKEILINNKTVKK